MPLRNLTALLYAAVILGSTLADPTPLKLVRRVGGLSAYLDKRQDGQGYVPSITTCGTGNTCAEACGAGYIPCLETATELDCFNPGAGDTCCADGTGNSCKTGYFCTIDSLKETFCCAVGSSLAQCAALNSVSDLSSEPTVAASTGSVTSISAIATASATSTTTSAHTSTATATGPGESSTPTTSGTVTSTGTVSEVATTTKTTTGAPVGFTGAAGAVRGNRKLLAVIGAAALLALGL